jgi:predicted mannosyl-3-phosphoglycerate phosphatase (HAD superfamily)
LEKQEKSIIARSCAKVEYRVISSAACELIWLKHLLAYFGFLGVTIMILFCDNQAVIHIASNLVFHEHTKHIEVDYHYIRQAKLVDVITKALLSTQFHRLLSKLGSTNPLDPA